MKKNKYLFLIAICFSFCRSVKRNSEIIVPKRQELMSITNDSEIKAFKKIDRYWKIGARTKLFGLSNIQSGYDSLQIRFWFDYWAIHKHLLIINIRAGVKRVLMYSYQYDERCDTICIQSIKEKDPKSGWNQFLKKIFSLDVLTLPNGHEIYGLGVGEDGVEYNVEVAMKNKYHFYSYWSPESTENEYWQAKKMEDILKLLETEFGFKRTET